MDVCESLRLRNHELLSQLRSQQSTFNSLLSSMGCGGKLNTQDSTYSQKGFLIDNLQTQYNDGSVKMNSDGETLSIDNRSQVNKRYTLPYNGQKVTAVKHKAQSSCAFANKYRNYQMITDATNDGVPNGDDSGTLTNTFEGIRSSGKPNMVNGITQSNERQRVIPEFKNLEDSSKRHIPPNDDKDYWKRMEQGNRTKAFLEETPRSILKHRQIIENNVPVQSKYNHTPTIGDTPHKSRLNHSYSQVDKEDANGYGEELDGSYLVKIPRLHPEVEELMRERRLKDYGNDRQYASVIAEIEQRPKSGLFLREVSQEQANNEDTSSSTTETTHKPSISSKPTCTSHSSEQNGVQSHMMGYDWIASLMDNQSLDDKHPDRFYEEMKLFRRSNRGECFGASSVNVTTIDLARPISPEVSDPAHKCIHGYSVNDRLYADAMNINEDGDTICPVCLIPRAEPKVDDPGFVRVSIPRSTLMSPYRVKPHRRKSFDPTDSCALSNHCLSGWECSQPSMLPTASNMDLTHAVYGKRPKHVTSSVDAESLAQSYSRSSKLTNALLNQSHSLRYELQEIEKEKGLNSAAAAHTTGYPLL